jgi:hypothetical protein
MYARVWKFSILPEKVDEFIAASNAVVPLLRQQPGFRNLVVLRGGSVERLEGTAISAWESLVFSCCQPRPSVREEEVVISEFASPNPSDTTLDYKRPMP